MINRRFTSQQALALAVITDPALRGKVLHTLVLHDEWCAMPDTGTCNCSPEYELREGTVETLQEGARLQREWRQRRSS